MHAPLRRCLDRDALPPLESRPAFSQKSGLTEYGVNLAVCVIKGTQIPARPEIWQTPGSTAHRFRKYLLSPTPHPVSLGINSQIERWISVDVQSQAPSILQKFIRLWPNPVGIYLLSEQLL